MVMSCAGLGQGIPSTLTNNVIAVVGKFLTSLVMMLCLAVIRTYQLPNDEQVRYVSSHGRRLTLLEYMKIWCNIHVIIFGLPNYVSVYIWYFLC